MDISFEKSKFLGIVFFFPKCNQSYEKVLPPAIWQQVFINVSPGDLCNVMITSLSSYFGSRSLVDVNLDGVNLSEVPADLLARAVSRLQTVNLCRTNLTTEQWSQVLEASLSSRSLVDVKLYDVNFSEVPADLLARAVSRLKIVNLYKTKLTTEQCIQVVEASISSKTLANVNICDNIQSLRGVPKDLLAQTGRNLSY